MRSCRSSIGRLSSRIAPDRIELRFVRDPALGLHPRPALRIGRDAWRVRQPESRPGPCRNGERNPRFAPDPGFT
jgi:hypothetical protein